MVRKLSALPLLALLGLASCSGKPEDETPSGSVNQIVYAVRQHTLTDADGNATRIDVAGGMGQVMDYNRYVPGGKLEVLDLNTGDIRNIIADYAEADVSSVNVSFDATKVLFTMKTRGDDAYHVYWAGLVPDESGKFEIHQLTFGAWDDINAVWAPGGRIVFVTNQAYTAMGTRADEYNHSQAVTQLATITFEGGDADRKLCSQNLSHIITLFNMQDGHVGFARWEHLENVNDVKLFAMNPDCTQMVALGGQHGKPGNSLVQVVESNTPNVFYGVVTNRENTIQAGSLFKLDASSALDPLRFDEEKSFGDAYELLTPLVPTGDEPSPIGRYRSPTVLPDGRLLVSWSDGLVNETNEFNLTPPDYGIYVYNQSTRSNELVVNHPETWEVYAQAVSARDEPVVLPSRQDTVGADEPARIGSIDVRQTSLYSKHLETVSGAQFESTPMDQALVDAVKVRIIEGFSSEAAPMTNMFGLTMAEGAALLGEAPVNDDGSWLAEIPPYIPVHLQPVDRFDLAIRNQTTWIQAMPGEDRVCGGCHEDRSAPVLPSDQQLSTAAGANPARFALPIAERLEYPWAYANEAGNPNEIQALFDQRCVSCHNETTNGDGPQQHYTVSMTDPASGMVTETYEIPRFDLTSRAITVTYDNDTRAWPASYVSIFYPDALQMEMGDGAEVEGEVPPRWGIPSNARGSALIEKLNIAAVNDAEEYAWPLGEEFQADPETAVVIAGGVRTDHATAHGMTRDEVVKLIRAIDLGGQFYARQNTSFVPFTNDPVGGTEL